MLYFEDCYNITIGGSGLIDGLGYDWWVREWKVQNENGRFNLIEFRRSRIIEIYGLELRNAPHSFIKVKDVDRVSIHDIAIETQIFKQSGSMVRGVDKALTLPGTPSAFEEEVFDFLCLLIGNYLGDYMSALRRIGGSSPIVSWPRMPLNTDGIDAGGSNIQIENLTIRNYDDAVVPKPANQGHKYSEDGCAQNIYVRNCSVMFGVGMSIGSMPPDQDHNCIRNAVFEDIDFEYPLKAIYVKTNPCPKKMSAEECAASSGEITDIRYERVNMRNPIWWGIYIGPQQQ